MKLLRVATVPLLVAVGAIGALAVGSPDWRRAMIRTVTPAPDPPMLPAQTLAYGTDYDDHVRYLEQVTWPALKAVEGQLESGPMGQGRLRGFRYLWPRAVPLGGGVTGSEPTPGTLHGALLASAHERGWAPVKVRGTHPLATTFAFRKRGRTFAVMVTKPNVFEFFPGDGRAVSVPIFGRPQPPADARKTEHVPLYVITNTFDPEGASYPASVVAPFLRSESKVRMVRRLRSEGVEIVERATWQGICGRGGSDQVRPWAPCVLDAAAVEASKGVTSPVPSHWR